MTAVTGTATQAPAIDVHAHAAVPAVDALVEGQPGLAQQRTVDAATQGAASLQVNLQQMAQLGPKLVDPGLRLAAMDTARVDVQAVSPVPLPHAWADRQLAARIIAACNEGVAALCAQEPARLLPIGTVSLQHPDLAVSQLASAASVSSSRAEMRASVSGSRADSRASTKGTP